MDLRLKVVILIVAAFVAIAFMLLLGSQLSPVSKVGAILLGAGVLAGVVWYAIDRVLYRPLQNMADEFRPASDAPSIGSTSKGSPPNRLRQLLAGVRDAQQKQLDDLEQVQRAGQETLEALHESEERYALAVRGANDGLWEWDIKSNAVYLSPRWKSMLGFTDENFPNSFAAWRERIHPEDLAEFEAALQRHLKGEAPRLESEHRVIHKDGGYRWVLSRAMALRHASGAPYRMLGLDTDTSQFKYVEEVLMHVAQGTANVSGEAFFRQLVQHFAEALRVRVVFVTRCMDTPPTRIRSIAWWDAGKFLDKEYSLEPTPCKKVIEEGVSCYIPQDLPTLFPNERASGLQSYLGIPIFDSQRKVLGHLVFKDDKKMTSSILIDSVYQIFVARAGVELERMEGRAALLRVAQGEGGAPAEERLRKIAGLLSESK